MPGVYTNTTPPTPAGMFDQGNTANPYKDWNMVYVPYCTGDVFFGTNDNGSVPRLSGQHFVGYNDMKLFIGRLVPTFKDKVDTVVLTGASAGGFGAALNFSMVQDAFGNIPVLPVDDSGPPFSDTYMSTCMQKNWREAWGYNGSLPPDCAECRQADGGGLAHLADFLLKKHPKARIALISTVQDEVIRLFYSPGLSNCANYNTADPIGIFALQADPNSYMAGQSYTDGLTELRTKYQTTGKFASYYMGGAAPNNTYHQHVFRSRFYDKGGANPSPSVESIADFVGHFINGQVETIGP
jgi:hypothetical protein